MFAVNFHLNPDEVIKMYGADFSTAELLPCFDIKIELFYDKNKLLLYENMVGDAIEDFERLLQKSLLNQAQLHESIQKNIGYLWSRYLNEEMAEICEIDGFWVGKRNLLWSPTGKKRKVCTTWLYNDHDGNIILEITPSYRWQFLDPKPKDDYITFDEFMKNYKTYMVKIIPHHVAKQWLNQVQELTPIMQKNLRHLI